MTPQFAFDYGIGFREYGNRLQALAFARGMAFARRRPNLRYRAMDEEPGPKPESESSNQETSWEKGVWLSTEQGGHFLLVNGKPYFPGTLDLDSLDKAVKAINLRISKEKARDEHKRIVAAKRFWGERHEGPKGMDAINFLLNKRAGYVPAAWHRDDVGDIDLCWGDSLAGLKHIIIRRNQERQNLAHVLEAMNKIIQTGERNMSRERNGSIVLEDESHRAVLSRPKYAHNRYVVSAFERYDKKVR